MAAKEKVVYLTGLLIEKNVNIFREKLQALADEFDIVSLDMQHVEMIDSMCLGLLVVFNKRMKLKGGKFTIINPSENVKELLILTSLKQYFHVTDTTEPIL
ncbi:MAG: STAS domain-containing protein [Calditrichota bacterium]